MIDNFGCGETNYNSIVSVVSNDNKCCYCCDIDDKNNLHLFGAKFEVRNGTDLVSFDTVVDILQLNDNESMTLKNIILCNGDIDCIKSVCIQSYVKSHINDIKKSLNDYNIVTCDIDNIGIMLSICEFINMSINYYMNVIKYK